jgi:hypothetical protein
MNDDQFEQHLRDLPGPALPEAWRASILAAARREAPTPAGERDNWPVLLVYLRHLCARNPFTTGALATLWLLILVFKSSTPVDPSEKDLMAHFDPNRPIRFISLQDEIELAQLWQDQPEQRQIP